MLKNLIKILALISFITLSSCAHHDNINIGEERSRIPSSDECSEIIKKFFPKAPLLEVAPQSLFGKNPQILKMMPGLFLDNPDYAQMYKDFLLANNKAPTLYDLLLIMGREKEKTLNHYEAVIAELKRLPNQSDESVKTFIVELKSAETKLRHFKSIVQINSELESSYRHGKTSIPNVYTTIPLDSEDKNLLDEDYYQFLKNRINLSGFQGEYGELFAQGATGDQVITRALTFDNDNHKNLAYQKLIIDRVNDLEKRLGRMSDVEIMNFVKPHKDGLFRMANEVLAEDQFHMARRTLVLEKIMNMIRSKEIDLVTRDHNGKVVWSEVKAYLKPITMKAIEGNKDKTVLDQLAEHKALRDVLGLTNDVRLRFIAPLSIVSDDAKEAIAKLGYEVISAK